MTSVAAHDWSGNWSFCDWLLDPATGCSCQSYKNWVRNRTGSCWSWEKRAKVQSWLDLKTLPIFASLYLCSSLLETHSRRCSRERRECPLLEFQSPVTTGLFPKFLVTGNCDRLPNSKFAVTGNCNCSCGPATSHQMTSHDQLPAL